MKVLTMIELELITDEVQNSQDAIDGIIVTTPIPDGRVKLGAQVVQLLVEYGFAGEDKWENVILVGTKADRATAEEIALFKSTEVDENADAMGIASQFSANAPGKSGKMVIYIAPRGRLR